MEGGRVSRNVAPGYEIIGNTNDYTLLSTTPLLVAIRHTIHCYSYVQVHCRHNQLAISYSLPFIFLYISKCVMIGAVWVITIHNTLLMLNYQVIILLHVVFITFIRLRTHSWVQLHSWRFIRQTITFSILVHPILPHSNLISLLTNELTSILTVLTAPLLYLVISCAIV